MIKRILATKIKQSAKNMPIVAVLGPRQSGKTTLVRYLFPKYRYVNLESPDTREHAMSDPRGFLALYNKYVIFDEIQRVPELFSYLQVKTDEDKIDGQYIITGSQHFLLMKSISQSLAGRVAIHTLPPLTYSEISSISPKLTSSLEKLIFTGSYPRIYEKKLDPTTWYGEYVSTYVERDLRELIQVGNLGTFLKFLRLLAGRTGQILNLSSLASDSGITHNTAKSWISILETSFIVFLLPPHYQNFNKQIIKAPKLYFYDTGLVCYLLGITSSSQLFTNPLIGHLFETWVISEYFKNTFAHKHNPNIYYYWRDKLGHEIDLLITLGNQTMLPIEIKYGQTINSDFFKNITYYQSLAGDNAPESTIIYGGKLKYSKNHTQIIPWFDL